MGGLGVTFLRIQSIRTLARRSLRLFLRDEKGQAVTEYILLLSITVFGSITLARAIIGTLDRGLLKLGGQLEKDLKTGRAPLGIWKN